MKLSEVKKVETNVVEFEVTVEKEAFEEAVRDAFKKNAKRLNVPGFRRGKAPRAVIERYYGTGVFYEEAVNELYPKAYSEAIEQAGIEPVDRADIEVTELSEEGFTFKAKVTVKPEVTLGEYKGLSAEKMDTAVTDEEVDAELERQRQRNARLVDVDDRPVEKDDIAVIDFEGFIDGVAFEGGKGENHELKIGSGQFIPGFEDQLIGKNIGEECDVNVTFPEEYHAEALKGKPAVFKVKINAIKLSVLPELDDEFAKDVSEDLNTLDELKADIRAKIAQDKERTAESRFEDALLSQVVENMTVEIPECMIEQETDAVMQDFAYRMSMQGLDMETYMSIVGGNEQEFRANFRDQAEKRVKLQLALDAIIAAEKIEATEEEIEAEYTKAAERFGGKAEELKAYLPAEQVARDVKVNKVIELVKADAKAKKPAKKKAPAKKRTTKKAAPVEETPVEEAPAEKTEE